MLPSVCVPLLCLSALESSCDVSSVASVVRRNVSGEKRSKMPGAKRREEVKAEIKGGGTKAPGKYRIIVCIMLGPYVYLLGIAI